jgi:hypothetical protein
MMKSLISKLIPVFLLTIPVLGYGQSELIGDEKASSPIVLPKNGVRMPAVVEGQDTFALQYLHSVYVYADRKFKSNAEQRRYNKLVRDVKIAYPYARMAGEKLHQYEAVLKTVKTESERHRIMKQVESELKSQYGDELSNLTVTQGRILLKLIDRETGDTSYELVKELRGSFSAFFWQSLAKLFGSDLKAQYDIEGDDRKIEDIILAIQQGKL